MDLQKYVHSGTRFYNNRPVRKAYSDNRAMTTRILEVLSCEPKSISEIANILQVRYAKVQGSIGQVVKHGDAERINESGLTKFRVKQ